jgi:hypothetical protein
VVSKINLEDTALARLDRMEWTSQKRKYSL